MDPLLLFLSPFVPVLVAVVEIILKQCAVRPILAVDPDVREGILPVPSLPCHVESVDRATRRVIKERCKPRGGDSLIVLNRDFGGPNDGREHSDAIHQIVPVSHFATNFHERFA